MTILLLLIPLSLLLVGVAAWAFVWAVRGGQFDDLDTPALDILGEDRAEAGADATSGANAGVDVELADSKPDPYPGADADAH